MVFVKLFSWQYDFKYVTQIILNNPVYSHPALSILYDRTQATIFNNQILQIILIRSETLRQSDWRILNWFNARTVHSFSTNHA